MKFLIDECLSPKLVEVAHQAGYEAYHVTQRGWSEEKDYQILNRATENDYIIVTNNRHDFLGLIGEVEIHPGLVVLVENVRRETQVVMFGAAIARLAQLGSVINKVVEVSSDRTVVDYDLPPE